MFDDVNANWKRTTKELFEAGTAYKGEYAEEEAYEGTDDGDNEEDEN